MELLPNKAHHCTYGVLFVEMGRKTSRVHLIQHRGCFFTVVNKLLQLHRNCILGRKINIYLGLLLKVTRQIKCLSNNIK